MTDATDMTDVRTARAEEYAAIGALTALVYIEAGYMQPNEAYVGELHDAERRAVEAELLVAVDGGGRVVGSVTYAEHGGSYAEVASPNEAEFRMLVVDPANRGNGVGTRLVLACLDRARAAGHTAVRLSSDRRMTTAHRLYERLGFHRTPDRDWAPVPDHVLLTYALPL